MYNDSRLFATDPFLWRLLQAGTRRSTLSLSLSNPIASDASTAAPSTRPICIRIYTRNHQRMTPTGHLGAPRRAGLASM